MPYKITQESCWDTEGKHKVSDSVIRNNFGQNLEVLEELNNKFICEQRAARLGTDMLEFLTRNLTCFSYFNCKN